MVEIGAYMLNPAQNEYASVYTASRPSAMVCALCALLFPAGTGRAALILVGLRTLAARMLYAPWLVLGIALPLCLSVLVWTSEGA